MSGAIPFRKMNGLGNEFAILDGRETAAGLSPDAIRALGGQDGIGFDQLITIEPSRNGSDARMRIHNRDGGEVEACGNATRCVAWLVMRETGRDRLTIRTERGLLTAVRQDGRVWVNMGAPLLDWQAIPLAGPGDSQHLPLPGDPVAVGMGNPHCVFIVADAEAVALDTLGPRYEHDPLFPQRTNVEFVSLTGQDRLRMRVWERGAGVTLACGSGACAVAVATAQRGLTGRRVVMDLDGGTLEADWRDDGVWLTGPVAEVFTGTLSAEALATP